MMATNPLVRAFEGWLETLDILADQELSQSIARGLKDAEAERFVEHEDLWTALTPPTSKS